ncbi:ABC transporter substrate-binding protein [Pseudogemmobacter humi]|uniref:Corrinoid ABC transporter substrate-binding protein n=1 Tax=Pseudogemmobacter humi TaxID=2483812 RepID=A0A3P5XRV6_9RHOB|nr:ABC transporter substrate-binding protein [Pseudogemmobacter humi]VDC31651.1 corrinoid ABC transporter substrate-binding protein [Pseudogemmobacter humi]
MGRAAVFALALLAAMPAWAGPPRRVVSINLCTDQLAMLLAEPGQLISVSDLATDPLASSMIEEARAYPANRGGAEQVFLMHPDLVLAGSYTSQASVALLRDLGVRVVQVAPVDSLAGVSEQIRVIAEALGRAEAGEALVRDFEAGLAALARDLPPATAALYYPNGYTTGKGTLADDVLAYTNFGNVGATAGVTGGGTLPMERLIMADPDVIVTSAPYPGASRSEEILTHPALTELRARAGVVATTDADWICGTPHILRAVAAMRAARDGLEAGE